MPPPKSSARLSLIDVEAEVLACMFELHKVQQRLTVLMTTISKAKDCTDDGD